MSGWVKIHQILHVIFETTSLLFFKFCITFREITLLYFFSWKFIWFLQKEPIKVQSSRKILTAQVKLHQICTLIGSSFLKVYKTEAKNVQRSYVSWYWHVLSKITWRIWQILVHRLKNSEFFQPDWPDAVWKLYFTLEINE